jgi:hypothetical protein
MLTAGFQCLRVVALLMIGCRGFGALPFNVWFRVTLDVILFRVAVFEMQSASHGFAWGLCTR